MWLSRARLRRPRRRGASVRIAFVGTGDPTLDRYPPGGGIERQVWLLAGELARRGHSVDILSRDVAAEPMPGVRIVHIPCRGTSQVIGKIPMSRRAASWLARERPDVVYLAEKWVSYFPSRLGLPSIYATHNKDAFTFYRRLAYKDNLLNVALFPLKRTIEESEMARANVIGANSPSIRDHLVERGIAGVELLPMVGELPETLAHAKPKPVIYTSGQLLRVKGVAHLIEAFAMIAQAHPEWRLSVGGRGPERRSLERLAHREGIASRVDFIEWLPREEYLAKLAECSIFCLPSLAETFGTVLLDAMAMSKPVIATDVPGPRDVVVHERTGLVVPPADPPALARALARLIQSEDLRRTLGDAGAHRARTEFTIQKGADAFERLARLAIQRQTQPAGPSPAMRRA